MVMGKRREKVSTRSHTLPSSPSHSFSSSSSSDFEFTISFSPRAATSSSLCPADDLFYKGQLLPLHLSPRLSMVRTLLSSSSSSSTASCDSTASSSNDSHSSFASDILLLAVDNCGSSRPSSVSEDNGNQVFPTHHQQPPLQQQQIKKNKYFSLSRLSSMLNKENNNNKHNQVVNIAAPPSLVKKISITAKRFISKYLKKVKPLKQQQWRIFSLFLGKLEAPKKEKLHFELTVVDAVLAEPLGGAFPKRVSDEYGTGRWRHAVPGPVVDGRIAECHSRCHCSLQEFFGSK
ncbi:armadillo/beta-catenin repeat family protein [Hibiscus syriacus]|uniref:Armadillo/beta-catenin repeat family protein n=1 Tax=Hibiscus syriacus TaxID=106335 RepID=A0A6A3CM64_HIBSY|nr:armadillo/beta-catenin repeat family protein [Hibiscus syriacus]